MAFVKSDTNSRRNLGDVVLQVESINQDEQSVSGVDLRTGEELTISLAKPDEIAKFFTSRNDSRPFEDRLDDAASRVKRRPDIVMGGKIEEGSVLRLENTRSFEVGGEVKHVAMWPEALARNPQREAVVIAAVEASIRQDGKPFLKLYDTDAPSRLSDFDMESAFTGDFKGRPMATSGIVVTARDENNDTYTSTLFTDFRSKASPSIESALNSGNGIGRYEVLAAGVVAASTGKMFDELNINPRVPEVEVARARQVYDDIVNGAGEFEVMVVPAATVQFIPTHAEPDFLKEFHGTPDGKADPKITPDAGVSYSGKGVVPSVISISMHKTDAEAPVSVRKVQPSNSFEFANQPERKIYMAMEEVLVETFGSTHSAAEPPEEDRSRNLTSDSPTI